MDDGVLTPEGKKCKKCGGGGPFPRYMKRGRMIVWARCVECCRADQRARTKTAGYKEWQARYRKGEWMRAWRSSERGHAVIRADREKWFARHKHSEKHKWAARAAVSRALRRGDLQREPCEVCGSSPAEAHHHKGYAREHRLTIRWLCAEHHRQEHAE